MAEEGVSARRRTRPLIGITQGNRRRQAGWWLMCCAIWMAGGRPCLIMPRRQENCDALDGLILAGGTDIHPPRYGGIVKDDYRYDLARDEMELQCFERAEREGLPVLGICRGAQMINVARGGTLCLDVAKTYEKAEYPSGNLARLFYRKPVRIAAGSKLAALLRCNECPVNSMHTQSVLRLGERLSITAMETNGVVQCIEDDSRNYLLGVQFHPEYLIYRKRFRRLFEELVAQAIKRGGTM